MLINQKYYYLIEYSIEVEIYNRSKNKGVATLASPYCSIRASLMVLNTSSNESLGIVIPPA